MKIIVTLIVVFFSFVVVAQNDDKLLLGIGLNYPMIHFVDSDGEESLLSDVVNISSNRLDLSYQKRLTDNFGLMASLLSNRYDVRTRYITQIINDNKGNEATGAVKKMLAMDYNSLISILTKAIQEQQLQMNSYKAENDELKNRISKIEKALRIE